MGVEQEIGDVGELGHDGTFPHFAQESQVVPSTLGVGDVPSSQPKVHVITKTWDLKIGPIITRGEMHEA